MSEHGSTRRHERRDGTAKYLIDAIYGLLRLAGIIAVMFLALSGIPMFGKRIQSAVPDAQGKAVPETGMRPQTVRIPEVTLPPIEYGIACDGEDRRIRDAFVDEISAMRDTSGFWPPTWITLPYPVLPSDDEPAFKHVRDLVNGVYADYPELSVYTDGQCLSATGFLSQWRLGGEGERLDDKGTASRLPWGDEATHKENIRELNEVTERLESVAGELAETTDSPGYAVEREVLGPDGLYVALVYRWVGSRTRYADGQDDTSHANDIYGALIEDESQCYGTACTIKALLERGGIPAFVATGGKADGTQGYRHAWVVVRMGGRWFSLDSVGAQVLREGDPIDLDLISARRGTWFSFMVPLDERLVVSELELDPICQEVMRRYEELVGPIEESQGMACREWLDQ